MRKAKNDMECEYHNYNPGYTSTCKILQTVLYMLLITCVYLKCTFWWDTSWHPGKWYVESQLELCYNYFKSEKQCFSIILFLREHLTCITSSLNFLKKICCIINSIGMGNICMLSFVFKTDLLFYHLYFSKSTSINNSVTCKTLCKWWYIQKRPHEIKMYGQNWPKLLLVIWFKYRYEIRY